MTTDQFNAKVKEIARVIKTRQRVRTIGSIRYLVPDTETWGDWMDADAIRHHGIEVGRMRPKKIAEELLHAVMDRLDAEGDDADVYAMTFTQLFARARVCSLAD